MPSFNGWTLWASFSTFTLRGPAHVVCIVIKRPQPDPSIRVRLTRNIKRPKFNRPWVSARISKTSIDWCPSLIRNGFSIFYFFFNLIVNYLFTRTQTGINWIADACKPFCALCCWSGRFLGLADSDSRVSWKRRCPPWIPSSIEPPSGRDGLLL